MKGWSFDDWVASVVVPVVLAGAIFMMFFIEPGLAIGLLAFYALVGFVWLICLAAADL